MNYRLLFFDENEAVRERYELSMDRIAAIAAGEAPLRMPDAFREYFRKTASFIVIIRGLWDSVESGELENASTAVWQDLNYRLYGDILPENYSRSFGNPSYAVRLLGEELGRLLSFLYAQIRGDIVFAYEMRLKEITSLNETFIEVYNVLEQWPVPARQVQDILYWFVSDYADQTVTYRVREGLDPSLAFARDIVMDSDLTDPAYLYRYGEYVSGAELQLASFMNHLPQDTINRMADAFTAGYCKGFEVMGRDLSRKGTVSVRYELGFERMIRRAVLNFRQMGLETVICRAAVHSINCTPNKKIGYHGTSPNRQYDYDHRYDSALYMGNALKERKLAVLGAAYEQYKELAAAYAGPAVVETFGEAGFEPVNYGEAYHLSRHQEKVSAAYASEAARIVNRYVPGDETSFTIIAFPKPEIGKDFEAIFRETIAVNTLDCQVYGAIQQVIIESLDEADYVAVTGRDGNETSMKVALHPLTDRSRQTNFENCAADVNIPLGEVFTSPVLAGTEGLLHVESVFISGFRFRNLRIWFKEGRVSSYSCENFSGPEGEEQGRALVNQVILQDHDSLPLGEFAIGTNTAAYSMAQRYHITERLPILIVEKMGPHFAVGDTCYSWSEDSPMYNPDGKEVIARDNEVSLLRKSDVSAAYFNCHTDVTLPYAKVGEIAAVRPDKSRIPIMRDGRFVLQGTEALNSPLDR